LGIFPKEIDWWQKIKEKNIKQGLDLKGGSRLVYSAEFEKLGTNISDSEKKSKLQVVRDKIERRVNKFGISEAKVYTMGNKKVVVEMPGVKDPTEIISAIGRTGELVFLKIEGESGEVQVIDIKPEDVKSLKADISRDNLSRKTYVIRFNITGESKDIFSKETGLLAGTNGRIVIMLDDEVLFDGTVSSQIPNGEGVMTGFDSLENADKIAKTIEEGALPVPLSIESQSEIEATLGEDALGKMIFAGIFAILLISILMITIFRLPGLIATFDLFVFSVVTIAIYKILGITLTLSGIAGFLLSLGRELDSSVLFFSRIKEELRKKRSVQSSVSDGFGNAWSAIKDTNISEIITSVILYYLGTTQVKGFAITLLLGTIISLFTSVLFTRALIEFVSSFRAFQKPELFGVSTKTIEKVEKKTDDLLSKDKRVFFEPLKFRKVAVFISFILVIFSGLLAILPQKSGAKIFGKETGILLGIEFKGGSTMDIVGENLDKNLLENIFKEKNIENLEIVKIDSGFSLKFDTVSNETKNELISKIEENYPNSRINFDTIGTSLSREIFINSILATVFSMMVVVLYLAFSFRKVPKPLEKWQFGASAMIALLNNIILLTGFYILITKFTPVRFDSMFVSIFLSTVGFSISDSIVLFDRVREKVLYREKFDSLEDLMNESISSTFSRTLLTGLSSQIVLMSIFLFGVKDVQYFTLSLFTGIIFGTFSSIFIGTSVLLLFQSRKGGKIQKTQ